MSKGRSHLNLFCSDTCAARMELLYAFLWANSCIRSCGWNLCTRSSELNLCIRCYGWKLCMRFYEWSLCMRCYKWSLCMRSYGWNYACVLMGWTYACVVMSGTCACVLMGGTCVCVLMGRTCACVPMLGIFAWVLLHLFPWTILLFQKLRLVKLLYILPLCMGPKCLLPRSQELSIGSNPESAKFFPNSHSLVIWDSL
jgi:hypothetical protein